MTEAAFVSLIKGVLRRESLKWKPLSLAKKKARVGRNLYKCNMCKQHVPGTVRVPNKRKPVSNIVMDHIDPIIDPKTGFTSWDDFIERLFCEEGKLQILCNDCHKIKTDEEKSIAAEYRKKRKEENEG